ncbi:hypothetical protein EW146_g7227 [Bondarzewia mesenterica]|uniref:chitinase n=1 Tax=Bondarzewia mesenterica TaxID=1095465 RepID=A0A4S4LLB9_9AGAM|nr:hypothetical protein EW146_g7227 [Bondarzewia mesenterica]
MLEPTCQQYIYLMSSVPATSLSLDSLVLSPIQGSQNVEPLVPEILAFDNSRYDNVAVYWGQNSYGATHSDTANFQKTISFYCEDDAIDVIPIAFLNTFFGTGGLPSMNLANGKIVTLSLGGATGGVGFTDDSEAESFAETIWDLYLGGSSSTRPFGGAVLDGVDLDIESGSSTGYAAFVTKIRSLASGASKPYYISAAPQCVYPDAALGATLNAADFDAIYVQFYNNPCGLQNFNEASNWDFGLWDNWARNISSNPDVKIYIGAPASSTAAGGGYQAIGNLSSIAVQMRNSFPSFGGVMLWDASQAYANDRYDLAIKNALSASGGTGFSFPACSAAAWASGSTYTAGSQASFSGQRVFFERVFDLDLGNFDDGYYYLEINHDHDFTDHLDHLDHLDRNHDFTDHLDHLDIDIDLDIDHGHIGILYYHVSDYVGLVHDQCTLFDTHFRQLRRRSCLE